MMYKAEAVALRHQHLLWRPLVGWGRSSKPSRRMNRRIRQLGFPLSLLPLSWDHDGMCLWRISESSKLLDRKQNAIKKHYYWEHMLGSLARDSIITALPTSHAWSRATYLSFLSLNFFICTMRIIFPIVLELLRTWNELMCRKCLAWGMAHRKYQINSCYNY